jgi:hypothetical protein
LDLSHASHSSQWDSRRVRAWCKSFSSNTGLNALSLRGLRVCRMSFWIPPSNPRLVDSRSSTSVLRHCPAACCLIRLQHGVSSHHLFVCVALSGKGDPYTTQVSGSQLPRLLSLQQPQKYTLSCWRAMSSHSTKRKDPNPQQIQDTIHIIHVALPRRSPSTHTHL